MQWPRSCDRIHQGHHVRRCTQNESTYLQNARASSLIDFAATAKVENVSTHTQPRNQPLFCPCESLELVRNRSDQQAIRKRETRQTIRTKCSQAVVTEGHRFLGVVDAS